MKATHLERRAPRKNDGFSWGRLPLDRLGYTDPGKPQGVHQALGVQYRLFLRDSAGKCHANIRSFSRLDDRRHVAMMLRGMRAQLRWVVDQLEFERIGLKDPTPCPDVTA
jgi:hypothetical protein